MYGTKSPSETCKCCDGNLNVIDGICEQCEPLWYDQITTSLREFFQLATDVTRYIKKSYNNKVD